MQITGQQLHEAFLYVSGEGRSWEQCSDALHDRYNAMAQRLMVLVEQQASIERLRAAGELQEQQEQRDELITEYTRDWLRDNDWMTEEEARTLAQAGYEQRVREAQA